MDKNEEMVEGDELELDVLTNLVETTRFQLGRLRDDAKRKRIWQYLTKKFDEEIYPRQFALERDVLDG